MLGKEKMKVLLLGAGASAVTLGRELAPVSADFGDVLSTLSSDWEQSYPFLKSAIAYLGVRRQDCSNWPLDVVWNGIDENYKLRFVISNDDFSWPPTVPTGKRLYSHYANRSWGNFWILAGWELKRALTQVYGLNLQRTMANSNLKCKWLSKQIERLNKQDVIVSMNYDLVAEHIARLWWLSAQNCRTSAEFQNLQLEWPLILKLHGSLDWAFRSNWITRANRVDRTPDGSPIEDGEIDLEETFWETRPVVVAPVRYKDEIVFPDNQPTELVDVLNFQWKQFVIALSKADELHVLGYRFPHEDSYGSRMLQEGTRRRDANAKLRIYLYLPNCECQKVKTRLENEAFRAGAVSVECCGPIPSE